MIDLNTLEPYDGGTAFPIVCETQTGSMIVSGGLTKRQYYATKAMQAMITGRDSFDVDTVIENAFQVADTMIQIEED